MSRCAPSTCPVAAPLAQAMLIAIPKVWHIPQTGEVFTTYDDYLRRYDGPHDD